MSLVEAAIKKMQAKSAEHAAAPDTRVVGKVTRVEQNAAAAPGAPARRYNTEKIVRVDRQALRDAGLLPPDHQERALGDQYRQIKRPLIAGATGRGPNKLANGQLIMMASAMPGEGKTFTSINLALSMSLEKDISVLLIDADVAKPHISRLFGVENEPGLLDVLHDPSIGLESVILPTDVPNLAVMPAGKASETATELLASNRMVELMGHLASDDPARIALIDSSPLLLTSESHVLTRVVGQVVLVVRAGATPQRAVQNALEQIADGASVGLILNQVTTSPLAYAYGYGYGDPQVASGARGRDSEQ
jgi:protein-tyrosine kinase